VSGLLGDYRNGAWRAKSSVMDIEALQQCKAISFAEWRRIGAAEPSAAQES